MADLDARLLRAFVAVAEELSFSRAAERQGVGQQGLSAQIRQLEGRLEAKLFRRTTRQVSLSPAGEALLPHARAALAELDAGIVAVRRSTEEAANSIRVAGVEDAGALGGLILERFAVDFPEVSVTVSDATPPQTLLDDGDGPPASVAFVRPPFRGVNRLTTVTLLSEPRVAVLPAGHRLAGRERVAPSELMGETWTCAGVGDRVADSFWLLEDHRYGRPPRIAGRARGWQALLRLVASGDAVAIAPASVVDELAPAVSGVERVAVEEIAPSALVIAWRPSSETAAVRELAEIARRVAQRS